jgi:hypothetical protein
MFRVLTCFIALSSASAQWTTSRIHGSPEPPKPFVPEQAFTQIALNDALEMIAVPGANRFVAVEKGGKIWSFKDSPGANTKDLLIDLKPDHPPLNYAYGIAFHPKWKENGFVFSPTLMAAAWRTARSSLASNSRSRSRRCSIRNRKPCC